MAVVIDSGPIDATDRAADLRPAQWPTLVSARRMFCQTKLSSDCRELLRFVEESHDMLEPLGYVDVDDFITRGLELEPVMVEWALQGLKRLQPDQPIPFQRAVALGKKGTAGPGRGHKTSRNTRGLGASDTRGYVLARLQRDGHSELIAQVYAGELSANAAAKRVGYRKKKTPLQQLEYWWTKASAVERQQFMENRG